MNSSPTTYSITRQRPEATPTVPEMCTLYHLIAKSALNVAKLRTELQACTPEQRAFLHEFFVRASIK